ncbi:hypothetical protein Pla110_10970 [Polystyrenella longa]|uniref:Cytochrome c domain-containing protein n=1 Tax=Polystyrenella longa TaxID=2528007 RepID=A0A518CJI7_9PLAN|nr:DUF1592 domain-containing protein [Polystyrenella longa]QDU79389.1 hypothetical protein Pla110_10970 [Polystyrenella longa]
MITPIVASITGLLIAGFSTLFWMISPGSDSVRNEAASTIAAASTEISEPVLTVPESNEIPVVTAQEELPLELAAVGKDSALTALADRQTEQTEKIPLQPIPDIDFATQVESFTKKFCIDCHGPDLQEGGLELHRYDSIESMRKSRKTWKHLAQLVEISAMPPVDMDPQPTKEEREKFSQLVELALNYVDCEQIADPGRETIQRLNRNEYNNTIRDLIGIEMDLSKNFPTDDVGEGFDNIGDVLSLSPILFEKYLEAAETATDAAIKDELATGAYSLKLSGKDFNGTGAANAVGNGTWNMASRGSVKREIEVYQDDTFQFVINAEADQAGPDLAQLDVSIDGAVVQQVKIQGHKTPADHKFEISLSQGTHQLEVAFVNDYYKPKSDDPKLKGDRNARLHSVSLIGSLPVPYDQLPETHRDIIFCRPDGTTTAEECARRIMARFATKAFRRPAQNEEVQRLVSLVTGSMEAGLSFEQGIELGVQTVLVSPHFLFRVEIDRLPNDPSLARRIDDYELASRLSYFLWSSMPDDELFELAEKNQLHYQTVLESQVRRMLQDKKSDALVENFGGQWLNLRNLDEIFPARKVFKDFKNNLRNDMRKETELFFAHVMREDMPLSTLLDGDFTFLNKRLAEHYGLPVEGMADGKFQKVSLEGQPRRGVLTQASILMLTSNPNRTAPVKRGKWILENILGEEPPPPPPNVPELEETKNKGKKLSLREQLAQHRADPGCASCHYQLDPLGFGLENFNAIGQWRDKDGEHAVDSSGVLPSGEEFNGPLELISILGNRKENFRELMAEKLLTYALGRGLSVYDQCATQEITEHLSKNDDRFSALVMAIINSEPFQKRRGEGEQQ